MDSRSLMINSCRGIEVDRTPVWFMRQAGRIFSEYRDLRQQYDFMTVCKTPELNRRVTCMPVKRLPVDAAIMFLDLMTPLETMNVDFELVSGKGPVLENPIRTPDDVASLPVGHPAQELPFLEKVIHAVREELPEEIPLIGFGGAPFTLACYMIEGESSRKFLRTKKFMLQHSDAWHSLMETLSDTMARYLAHQIECGVEIVQLFDSWVGILAPAHYRQYVLPYVRSILEVLDRYDVPKIYFGTSTAGLLEEIDRCGAEVIGLDWRIEIQSARSLLSPHRAVQGNLDPSLMHANFERIKPELDRCLEQAQALPGHVFNLGHGLLPDTPLDTIKRVSHYVRQVTEREEFPETAK